MDLKIDISGHNYADLELALEETLRLIKQEFRSGSDENTTGNYSFEVEGSPVWKYAINRDGQLLPERFFIYDEAADAAKPGDDIIGLSETDEELYIL